RGSRAPFRLHTTDQKPGPLFRTQANQCRLTATEHRGVLETRAAPGTSAQPALQQVGCLKGENPADLRQTSTNLCLKHPGSKRAIHRPPIQSSRSLDQPAFRAVPEQPSPSSLRMRTRRTSREEAAKKRLSNPVIHPAHR